MKIAFTATGETLDSQIDPRFGRTDFILVLDEETNNLEVINNLEANNEAHGAGTATSRKIYQFRPDVLITGNGPGDTAAKALKPLNMKIFTGAYDVTVRKAYELYKQGQLKEISML
ncbi:MAG TPA: NifB/NifX family molybdenum-iron cluster-binding protein [Bacteroidales bacterium]|nr:NifB/NifX family molybdenum-iron cluster-binding protein [Bacteroidales bacterium]HPT01047.1 NifB/NifX family molybdenum-iron cluster-binding protein [Bacteroidales bacterium]